MNDQQARSEVDKRRGIHGIIGGSVLIVLMSIALVSALLQEPNNLLVTIILAISLLITCVGMKIMIGKTNQTTAALRSFARYIPASEALKILKSCEPASLGSNREQVAVLFTDLKGFDKLAAELDDDLQLISIINGYFTVLIGALDANGASIDKLMGDSLMAYWRGEDAAAQAVAGVRAATQALEMFNEARRAHDRSELATSMGVAFGEAQVGNFGSPLRMNHSVYGDLVNSAALLTSAAGKGEHAVLFTQALRDAAGDAAADLVDAGSVEIRHRDPMQAYTLAEKVAGDEAEKPSA